MSDFSDHWAIEKQLWTGPAGGYDGLMADDCRMIFPLPAGILTREQIITTVKQAPRWDDVEFDRMHASQPDADIVILTYVGRGLQEKNTYEAFCSSTYVKTSDGWRILQHQQTPA
jgi:hypothetical protein